MLRVFAHIILIAVLLLSALSSSMTAMALYKWALPYWVYGPGDEQAAQVYVSKVTGDEVFLSNGRVVSRDDTAPIEFVRLIVLVLLLPVFYLAYLISALLAMRLFSRPLYNASFSILTNVCLKVKSTLRSI